MFFLLLLIISITILVLIKIYKNMDYNPLPPKDNLKNMKPLENNINNKTFSQNKCVQNNPDKLVIDYKNQNNSVSYKKYYKPKRYIITKNELTFYNVLFEVAKDLDLLLLTQVSLYNILEPKNSLDYKTRGIYFNKIASKSIDFVLVDKNNCRIKLCIELDDSTHNQQKRIQRDTFLNELFKDLEIDFIRFKVSNYYPKDALKSKIKESIKDHYYID